MQSAAAGYRGEGGNAAPAPAAAVEGCGLRRHGSVKKVVAAARALQSSAVGWDEEGGDEAAVMLSWRCCGVPMPTVTGHERQLDPPEASWTSDEEAARDMSHHQLEMRPGADWLHTETPSTCWLHSPRTCKSSCSDCRIACSPLLEPSRRPTRCHQHSSAAPFVSNAGPESDIARAALRSLLLRCASSVQHTPSAVVPWSQPPPGAALLSAGSA